MHAEPFHLLITLVPIGTGLLFAGMANMAFRGRHAGIRVITHAAIIAVCAGAILPLQLPAHIPLTVAASLLCITAGFALSSSVFMSMVLAFITRILRRNAFQSAMLIASGVGIVVFGLIKFDADEDASMTHDTSSLEQMAWKPPISLKTETLAHTDQGHTVLLHQADIYRPTAEMDLMERQVLEQLKYNFALIRHNGPDDGTNCHGWVFTGGRYWLGPDMVGLILADNGYHPVDVPEVGDIVIYHEPTTRGITHSAVVKYVGADSPIVEGKWGWMGVFLHPVDQSCYGSNYTYYRSDRDGNLLIGLGGKPHRGAKPTVTLPPAAKMDRPQGS